MAKLSGVIAERHGGTLIDSIVIGGPSRSPPAPPRGDGPGAGTAPPRRLGPRARRPPGAAFPFLPSAGAPGLGPRRRAAPPQQGASQPGEEAADPAGRSPFEPDGPFGRRRRQGRLHPPSFRSWGPGRRSPSRRRWSPRGETPDVAATRPRAVESM